MNSVGRHYRDQDDTDTPTCDYELNGVKCSFFTTSEFATLTYPEDISTGPVSETASPQTNSDISAILSLLTQQKADAETQARQMQSLQEQVNNILLDRTPAAVLPSFPPAPPAGPPGTAPSTAPGTVASPTPSPPVFTTATAPPMVASAAANMSAALQSGLGHQHNYGYTGLTMDNLRQNPAMVAQAASVLNNATQNVPPLNPLDGMGPYLRSNLNISGHQVINSVDQLYQATTVNKQLRCFEFASTVQFSYRQQLKQDNCNAVTFAFGALKHLEACKTGLINISDTEFLSRIRHLKNVFELACLSSTLTSYAEPSWNVAREYDSRVIADIESGAKSWDTLSVGIEPDSIYCAKETVEIRKSKKTKVVEKDKKNVDERVRKDPKKNGCTTYNTHKTSDGCYWESQNKGESCVFDHFCSWCKLNRNVADKHKVFDCEYKSE